jgi:hypothetical protein
MDPHRCSTLLPLLRIFARVSRATRVVALHFIERVSGMSFALSGNGSAYETTSLYHDYPCGSPWKRRYALETARCATTRQHRQRQ